MRKYHYPKIYSHYCPLLRCNYSFKVFGFVIFGFDVIGYRIALSKTVIVVGNGIGQCMYK